MFELSGLKFAGLLIPVEKLFFVVRKLAGTGPPAGMDCVRIPNSACGALIPSLVEGFGMPVLEAMAAGLAVVASDAEAVREVAAGGSLIVPARTTAAWIQALDLVLTDPGVGRDLRERGQAIAARHTWARSAERTLSLLASAARRDPAGSGGTRRSGRAGTSRAGSWSAGTGWRWW